MLVQSQGKAIDGQNNPSGRAETQVSMSKGDILTSKDVQELLQISKNTLLKLERELQIVPDFRIGNGKRYYITSIVKSIKKMQG